MNEYILKVMVWLENKDFYSKEVMKENYCVAYAYADDDGAYAADAAAADAAAYASADAAYWVDVYFKRSGDNRENYKRRVQEILKKDVMIIEMNGKRYKLVEVKSEQ